ncbi:MAG: sigma-70 family RNA polymerase sigma factor [Pirellulaceae bacterium]|jgi:RNA polymerase sigma-70 factor (ECF subfamily)
MSYSDPDTDQLLDLATGGDEIAIESLFQRHRSRLRQMAAVRLDPRLLQRVDPSDIVQETLIDAYRRLPEYLRDRPLPFYPWLRGIAFNRLIDLHRRHIRSMRRSVTLETPLSLGPSRQHSSVLIAQLSLSISEPLKTLLDGEMQDRIQKCLATLPEIDREVLILRHLEALSVIETAAVLKVKEGTVKSRHFRALERLRLLLINEADGDQ